MGKDPAISWYWNDWHGRTVTLSRFLKGCYMDLLYAQFNNGHLSLDEIKIVLGTDFVASWPSLQKKFTVDKAGKYFNERMEHEKEKRRKFIGKQTDNGKKGGRPPNNPNNNPKETQIEPKRNPLENENDKENELENSFGKSENLLAKKLSETVLEAIERNQFSHTGERNTDFIKSQWEVFLAERSNDNAIIQQRNKHRLGEYFTNWMRTKFPKKEKNGKQKQGTSDRQLDGLKNI